MQYFFPIISLLSGLIFGSFINCLIWRLYQGEKITGRSYCPKCKHQIAWYDNLPVLSFAFLKGHCRNCKQPISWQYPLVELAAGCLFLLAYLINFRSGLPALELGSLLPLLRDWFVILVMIIIFIYDLRWYLILDIVTLPAAVSVLLLNLSINYLQNQQTFWLNLLFSGIIGGSFFLVQFIISRGRWIGGGDIRMGLLMGLALGWPNILVAIFLAYIIGSVIGTGLMLLGKKSWGSQIPFGVFLSVATLIALFWGNEILNWYLNILNY